MHDLTFFKWPPMSSPARNYVHIQGVQGQIFMFQFALTDRNMQARFGLKVFWES